MIKAILFDLDGVLIETELETFKFYQKKFKEAGLELKDEDFKYKAGRKSHDFFNNVLKSDDQKKIDPEKLLLEKRRLFSSQIDKYAKKMPGVRSLLNFIKSKELLIALASQNESRMINSALDWLDIKKYFDVLLSLDDIRSKKPNPEIYQLACKKLGLKPKECMVVEDSKDGVAAAKNAKMFCIGLFHDYMPKDTLDEADIIIKSLDGIKKVIKKRIPMNP